jgi:hypothetical protein
MIITTNSQTATCKVVIEIFAAYVKIMKPPEIWQGCCLVTFLPLCSSKGFQIQTGPLWIWITLRKFNWASTFWGFLQKKNFFSSIFNFKISLGRWRSLLFFRQSPSVFMQFMMYFSFFLRQDLEEQSGVQSNEIIKRSNASDHWTVSNYTIGSPRPFTNVIKNVLKMFMKWGSVSGNKPTTHVYMVYTHTHTHTYIYIIGTYNNGCISVYHSCIRTKEIHHNIN